MRKTENASYTPNRFVDSYSNDSEIVLGDWRQEVTSSCFTDVNPAHGSRYADDAILMRDRMKEYLYSVGSIDWQLGKLCP